MIEHKDNIKNNGYTKNNNAINCIKLFEKNIGKSCSIVIKDLKEVVYKELRGKTLDVIIVNVSTFHVVVQTKSLGELFIRIMDILEYKITQKGVMYED